MITINIQSISDLITNSSTEVFVVYAKENIESIKNLVNAVLSLENPDKSFDDYFTIEMVINYEDVSYALEDLYEDDGDNEEFPEAEIYAEIEDWKKEREYVEGLPIERVEQIIDAANDKNWDTQYQLYSGFVVNPKVENPVTERVASIINNVDSIFDIDYSANY